MRDSQRLSAMEILFLFLKERVIFSPALNIGHLRLKRGSLPPPVKPRDPLSESPGWPLGLSSQVLNMQIQRKQRLCLFIGFIEFITEDVSWDILTDCTISSAFMSYNNNIKHLAMFSWKHFSHHSLFSLFNMFSLIQTNTFLVMSPRQL